MDTRHPERWDGWEVGPWSDEHRREALLLIAGTFAREDDGRSDTDAFGDGWRWGMITAFEALGGERLELHRLAADMRLMLPLPESDLHGEQQRWLGAVIAPQTRLSIVCGWCRKPLGTKDGQGVSGETTGICADCAERVAA